MAPYRQSTDAPGFERSISTTPDRSESATTCSHRADPFWSLRCARLQLAVLLGFGGAAASLMRNNLGIALVCMVNSTHMAAHAVDTPLFTSVRHNDTAAMCLDEEDSSRAERISYEGSVLWTSADKSAIISAFFWGSLVGSFIGGWLADRYGAKVMMSWSNAIMCALSFALPSVASHASYVWVAAIRFVMGLASVGRAMKMHKCATLGHLVAASQLHDRHMVRTAREDVGDRHVHERLPTGHAGVVPTRQSILSDDIAARWVATDFLLLR